VYQIGEGNARFRRRFHEWLDVYNGPPSAQRHLRLDEESR
jgi:hypothetical protein